MKNYLKNLLKLLLKLTWKFSGGTRESLSSPEGVNLNEVELAAQEILQRVAIESVDKTNELVNQGQQKLAELEHTKKNIQQFESDLQFLKE